MGKWSSAGGGETHGDVEDVDRGLGGAEGEAGGPDEGVDMICHNFMRKKPGERISKEETRER